MLTHYEIRAQERARENRWIAFWNVIGLAVTVGYLTTVLLLIFEP